MTLTLRLGRSSLGFGNTIYCSEITLPPKKYSNDTCTIFFSFIEKHLTCLQDQVSIARANPISCHSPFPIITSLCTLIGLNIAWRTFIGSAWKTFEMNFKPILDSLKRHRSLLSDEKLTAAIIEIQEIRQLAVTRFNDQSTQSCTRLDELSQQIDTRFHELSRQLYENQKRLNEKETRESQEILHLQRRVVAEKLKPPDYESDQRLVSEQRFSASGDWILNDPNFSKWIYSDDPSYSMLYMHGIPGAGK